MTMRPIAIATWSFGVAAVGKSGEILAANASALDAMEQGIRVAELDVTVPTVGYGGMPNAAGVMEMDAAIMDGATHDVGCIAALVDCKTPISVARAVMEHSRHSMLVGTGAREFATAHGFAVEDALHETARETYHLWLEDGHAKP